MKQGPTALVAMGAIFKMEGGFEDFCSLGGGFCR